MEMNTIGKAAQNVDSPLWQHLGQTNSAANAPSLLQGSALPTLNPHWIHSDLLLGNENSIHRNPKVIPFEFQLKVSSLSALCHMSSGERIGEWVELETSSCKPRMSFHFPS